MASRAFSSFATNPAPSPRSLLSHGGASPAVSLGFSRKSGGGRAVVVAAATVDTNNMPMTGVVFQPFEEVKKADLAIPITSNTSLARQRYADVCEATVYEEHGEKSMKLVTGITEKQTIMRLRSRIKLS